MIPAICGAQTYRDALGRTFSVGGCRSQMVIRPYTNKHGAPDAAVVCPNCDGLRHWENHRQGELGDDYLAPT